METHLVFVYGTLKRGCRNHAWLRGQIWLGEGVTEPCFAMFDAGGYPAMVRSSERPYAVRGEIWQVDHEGLADLDRLEANGSLFQREVIPVQDERGRWHDAWAYLFLGELSGCRETGPLWPGY